MGVAGATRTRNLQLRGLMLSPIELRRLGPLAAGSLRPAPRDSDTLHGYTAARLYTAIRADPSIRAEPSRGHAADGGRRAAPPPLLGAPHARSPSQVRMDSFSLGLAAVAAGTSESAQAQNVSAACASSCASASSML